MSKVTGGIYIPHLKHEIVTPALDYLGLGGQRAINQVTGTFLAEGYASGYTYLKQLGNGPAVGAMQMEPATYNDIWKNFLSATKRSQLAALLKNISGEFNTDNNGIPKPTTMTGNIFFAAAMCRVFYLRISEALPLANDATAMAQYHKKYYNTEIGKAENVLNINKSTQYIYSHAQSKSIGYCARYVANALEAGGLSFARQPSAYLYNNELPKVGFKAIASGGTLDEANQQNFLSGDIVVFDKTPKRSHGHIAMRSNNIWVSDFKQKNFCPYAEMLPWTIWRFEQSSNVDRFQQAIDA